MHIEQLKLLAAHVRELLKQNNHIVGHSQSLDLIAAISGLRNWPEVQAFPARVEKCELDQASAGRLAYRLKKKFELEFTPQDLLATLVTTGVDEAHNVPYIWPSGPVPGVYITTSQNAVDLMLDMYDEATDGALIYAERAGGHSGSIDLGDYGLWSQGLDRVASGTLLVVGPLQLCQQSWKESGERLEMACYRAVNERCRVVVLLHTPSPDTLHQDVKLLVESFSKDISLAEEALRGVVTDEGELRVCSPFANPWPEMRANTSQATSHWAPPNLYNALSLVLRKRSTGLIALGSSKIEEFAAMSLAVDVLNMTGHLGPAARVMPRDRSTPSKDWNVPDAIKAIPYLPSIQSAYAQGYRRIIISPSYTTDDALWGYSADALLISTAFATGDVTDVFLSSMRLHRDIDEGLVLDRIIALIATIEIESKRGDVIVSDLYLNSGETASNVPARKDLYKFIVDNRTLAWEPEVSRLLDSRKITAIALGKAFPRNNQPKDFLAGRKKQKHNASIAR